MSLTADLALVTACRDALAQDWVAHYGADVVSAALSLIEDTLNRHAPIKRPLIREVWCEEHHRWWATPCVDYRDSLAALHTIATALGVEVPA